MVITKKFEKYSKWIDDWHSTNYYTIKYICKDFAFMNQKEIKSIDTVFVNLFNLNNEEFLKQHKIEYIVDKDKNIIPIGIVDFIKSNDETSIYNETILRLCCLEKDNLYECNKILSNIDKAIQIKYDAVKFINKVDSEEKLEL